MVPQLTFQMSSLSTYLDFLYPVFGRSRLLLLCVWSSNPLRFFILSFLYLAIHLTHIRIYIVYLKLFYYALKYRFDYVVLYVLTFLIALGHEFLRLVGSRLYFLYPSLERERSVSSENLLNI